MDTSSVITQKMVCRAKRPVVVHEVESNCWQITGPPGTGKTTWLAEQALREIEEVTAERVIVASLTRAAAYAFSSRGLSAIPDDQIGTLHMICRRALGNPELTQRKSKDWKLFLQQEGAPSRYEVTQTDGPKGMDRNTSQTDGDKLLQTLTVIRNKHPGILKGGSVVHLTHSQRTFHELWEAWKDEAQLLDFTDLLEQCLEIVDKAPGNPQVMFGDEAQDWSQLEVQLFRDKWGQHAAKVFLIGDPDQAIYEWRGADPRIFLDHPVPPEQKILLSQSYRVPRAVRNAALGWIERKIRDRDPVKYESRPGAGLAGVMEATYRTPWKLKSLIADIRKRGETVMILGSCAYMLRPICAQLKEWGIPYGNPYRSGDKAWNPLRLGTPKTATSNGETTRLDHVLAFLEPSAELRGNRSREWTWKDISLWISPIRATGDSAVMAHGAKTALRTFVKNQKIAGAPTMDTFNGLFRDPHHGPASAMNLDWWFDSMRPAETKRFAYYRAVIENFGQRALMEKPLVWPGTIHSVKGGEADNVILFPDLSPSADELYWGTYPDPIVRLFYVAMTRAHKNLIICSPNSPHHVEIGQGLPHYQRLPDEKCEVPF